MVRICHALTALKAASLCSHQDHVQTSSKLDPPPNCLTDIQGFNEPQKEDYFRKRISDYSVNPAESSNASKEQKSPTSCAKYQSSAMLQKLLKEDISSEILYSPLTVM